MEGPENGQERWSGSHRTSRSHGYLIDGSPHTLPFGAGAEPLVQSPFEVYGTRHSPSRLIDTSAGMRSASSKLSDEMPGILVMAVAA